MNTILLGLIIVCLTMQTVTKKAYNNKVSEDGKYFFSAMVSFAAMMFFVLTSDGFSFDKEVLPYAVCFAVFYGACTVCNFIALSSGLMSITALIISYSLMIPTVYGLMFLNEKTSLGLYAGVIFLLVSLFLICKKCNKAPITLKWVINVSIAFLGNGMCSVVQKMQQLSSGGEYKNEFMIIALGLTTVFFGILAAVKERDKIKGCMNSGLIFGISCGVMNGIVNLFVMVLSARMPVSIMFPTISAGDVVLTYIISRMCFREQLSRKQFFGFCFGVISVILLNI